MTVHTVDFVAHARIWVVGPSEPPAQTLGSTAADVAPAAPPDAEEQAAFRRADEASMAAFEGFSMFAADDE